MSEERKPATIETGLLPTDEPLRPADITLQPDGTVRLKAGAVTEVGSYSVGVMGIYQAEDAPGELEGQIYIFKRGTGENKQEVVRVKGLVRIGDVDFRVVRIEAETDRQLGRIVIMPVKAR